MTNIDEFVTELSAQAPKGGENAAALRLAIGLALGVAGAGVLLVIFDAVAGSGAHAIDFDTPVWKIAYSLALAFSALMVTLQFASPETRASRRHLLAFAPVMMMAMIAMTELFTSPPETWLRLMFGYGVSSCVTTIFIISPPIFAGMFWAFRRFAATDYKTAGAAIGALSGALAGALYAAVSGDTPACFVFIWYSVSVAATAFAGALAGPRFLRW